MWWFIIGAIVAIGSGIFWAIGGDKGGAWRDLGVPLTIATGTVGLLFLTGVAVTLWWLAILVMVGLLWASTTIGYGIPDDPANPHGDDGSPMGAFFYKIAPGATHTEKAAWANFMTRLVCGFAYGGSICILSLVKLHWWWGIIAAVLVAVNTVYINAISDDPGPIAGLNGREFITGFGVGVGAMIALI